MNVGSRSTRPRSVISAVPIRVPVTMARTASALKPALDEGPSAAAEQQSHRRTRAHRAPPGRAARLDDAPGGIGRHHSSPVGRRQRMLQLLPIPDNPIAEASPQQTPAPGRPRPFTAPDGTPKSPAARPAAPAPRHRADPTRARTTTCAHPLPSEPEQAADSRSADRTRDANPDGKSKRALVRPCARSLA